MPVTQRLNESYDEQLLDVTKRKQNLGVAHDAAVLGDMVEMLRMNRAKDRAATRSYNGEASSMPEETDTPIHVGDIYMQGIEPGPQPATPIPNPPQPPATNGNGKLSPLVAGTLGLLLASLPSTAIIAYLAGRQPVAPVVQPNTDTDTRNTIRPYVPKTQEALP